jgi:hypothetical protein
MDLTMMGTTERLGKRFTWRVLAITAAVAALTMAVADGAVAKKKLPFKTGAYPGMTSQGQPMSLAVEKKTVNVVYVDLAPPCFVSNGLFPPPSFAGLQGDIKVMKIGDIAFGPGRKRAGVFEVDAPGGGYVRGYIKGRKAEGFADDDYPGCPSFFDWEAERE